MNITWFLFSFNGRVTRQQFWIFTIVSILIIMIPAYIFFGNNKHNFDVFLAISRLVILWPAVAVHVKRWHDRNKSGWWELIVLIPIIGVIWAIVELGFLPGITDQNNFGDNQTENVSA